MASACSNALHRPPAAERILVVRLGALGDVVRTTPAVAALRRAYPDAHVAWLSEPASLPLLREQTMLDEVICFERPAIVGALRSLAVRDGAAEAAALWRRLRGFDLVVDFHSILRSAVLVRASGAPLRVGYAAPEAREGAQRAYSHLARLAPGRRSRFERNAALVEFLGLPHPGHGHRLDVSEAALRRVRSDAAGLEGCAVLHPGSSPAAPWKQWPEDSFAELARRLHDECGVASRIAFGPVAGEREAAERIADAAGAAAQLAPETRDVAALAALLAQARLFVGADSGPLHMASLVGTPVVQLLGPTDPTENEAWPGTPWRRAHRPVACSPCRRGCADPVCMRALPAGDALVAARELLALAHDGQATDARTAAR